MTAHIILVKITYNFGLVPRLINSVPDFGNLSCHQIRGTTLKNPNIETVSNNQNCTVRHSISRLQLGVFVSVIGTLDL